MSEHKLTYVRLVGKLGAGAGPGTFFSVVMPNADGEYLPLGVVSDGEGLVGSMYEEEALSMIHDRTAVPCDEHGTPDRVAILDRKLADNDGIFAASDMTSEEWDQLYDELGKARATIQKAQEDKPFYYAFNPDEPVSAHLPDAWRISTQKTVTARFERNVTIPGIELHEVTIAGRIRFEAGYFFFTIRNLSFPLTPVELGIEEEHVAAIGEAINERNARLGWINPFDAAADIDGRDLAAKHAPTSSFNPLDLFGEPTMSAAMALRRGVTGGRPMFTRDLKNAQVRSTSPVSAQADYPTVIFAPKDQSAPLVNWNDEEASNREMESYLAATWEQVAQLGPGEADWFDLILAEYMQGWRQRDRNRPATGARIPIYGLKKYRTKGKYKGFDDTGERREHCAMLERLLSARLLWLHPQTGRSIEMPYFEYTKAGQTTTEGRTETTEYFIFPTLWFDLEMQQDNNRAAKYFAAASRMVIQIPANKEYAKAIGRFMWGFWRMRAADPKRSDDDRYKITLSELFDRAGVVPPEWAKTDPSKWIKRLQAQLDEISDPCTAFEGALISRVVLPTPPRGKGGFDKWLRETIELRPHPKAPYEILQTIERLECRGKRAAALNSERQERAEVKLLAESKRRTRKRQLSA